MSRPASCAPDISRLAASRLLTSVPGASGRNLAGVRTTRRNSDSVSSGSLVPAPSSSRTISLARVSARSLRCSAARAERSEFRASVRSPSASWAYASDVRTSASRPSSSCLREIRTISASNACASLARPDGKCTRVARMSISRPIAAADDARTGWVSV
ncbi:hypothetical protein KIPE111705_18120 [Kibdelosporangium persicum]